MRRISFVLAAVLVAGLLSGSIASAQAPRPADELVTNAVKTAKADGKVVLIEFGASWCGWCTKFNAFVNAPEVKSIIANNYVILNLTVQESDDKKALENPGGMEMMTKLGGPAGLPFYAFVDGSGTRIANSNAMPDGSNIGFPANDVELKAFIGLLDKTAPKLKGADRATVVGYLNKTVPQK